MQKYLPLLTLLFLVTLIAFSTYKLNNKQNSKQDSNPQGLEDNSFGFSKVRISLPEFSLVDLFDEEETFSKKDLKKKYSIINFFASWCTTCHAEHEVLLRLRDENLVDIYGIAWRDIDENTITYLRSNGNPYTKVAKDNAGLFTKITGIKAVPETLIINPEGNVIARYRGNLQEFSIDEIKRIVKK